MQEIYYVFLKSTGEYMGSGTPYFDDEIHGCTTVPSPEYNYEVELPFWTGSEWELRPLVSQE
jgi:hypothetical protein